MNYNQYFSDLKSFKSSYKNKHRSSLFNVISINMRSISSIDKFNKFKTLINKLPRLPDIICVQETWFSENLIQIYKIAGFKAIHCCRLDSYGGTSIFIRENIQCAVETIKSQNFIEYIVLTLSNLKLNGKDVKFISFYRSQKCNTSSFLLFIENLLKCYGRSPCIMVGDSNIDVLTNHSSQDLLNTLNSYDFKNCHLMITRPKSKTSIDHIYSNVPDTLCINSIECRLTDHNIINFDIQIASKENRVTEKVRVYCNREQVIKLIRRNILSLIVSDDPAVDIESLISLINSAENESTTRKKEKVDLKHSITPWINGNLKKLIDLKDKLLSRRRKRRGNYRTENMLKGISKVIKTAYNDSMNNYYIYNIDKMKNEPVKTWHFLNDTLGRANDRTIRVLDATGSIILDDLDMAEVFNKYFLQVVKDVRSEVMGMSNDHFNSLRTLNNCVSNFRIQCPGFSVFEDIILKISTGKSRGYDNISSKNIVDCRDVIIPYLVHIFNNMIIKSAYPTF